MHRQNVFTSGTDQRSSRRPGQDKGQNKLHPRFQTLGTAPTASTEQSLLTQTPGHASSIPFSHPTTGFNPQQFFTPQELGANQLGLMHFPRFPNAVSSPVHAPSRCRNPSQNQSQRSPNNNRIPPLCQAAAGPSSQGHQLHHTFNSMPPASFQCPGGFNLPDPGLHRGLGINQHPDQMLCGSNQSLCQQSLPGPGLSTLRWTYRPNKNSSTPPRSAYQPYMTSYGRQGQSFSTPPLNHQGPFTSAQSSVRPGTGYARLSRMASDTSSQYLNPVSDAQSTQSVYQSIPNSREQGTVTTSPSSVSTTLMTSSSISSSCVMCQSEAASTLGSVTSASSQTSLLPFSIQSHHSRKGQNLTNFQQAPVSKSAQKKGSAMAFWLSCVKEWFPDRQTTTYFLPPQHFNRVQYGVDTVADETVLVPEVPSTQVNPGPGPLYPTGSSQGQSSQTVAGTIWTQNQGPLAPLPRYQQKDLIDDAATEHVLACLRALSDKEDQIMMVISKLEFRKYLDKKSDPIHAADCRLFPRPDKIVGWKCNGECDLLIIHRQFGIIIGEIKSVGANISCIPNLDNAVVKRVRKAVDQLNKAANVLSHLISDISKTIPITRTLILPFITSAQLTQALAKDSLLQQEFCHCLDSPDLTLAVSRCLCKDCMPKMADVFLENKSPATESRQKVAKTYKPLDLYKLSESSDEDETGEGSCESPAISQDEISSSDSDDSSETTASAGHWSQKGAIFSKLASWWKEITNNPRIKATMTDCLYDQLLARFCGPATTVDVPTVTAPRLVLKKGFEPQCKVLRTRGQAVAETGLIMSTLALYPQQVDILNDKTLHNVHLCGPPGVGKTLLITLKAIQWLNQGHSVDLLILSPETKAVSMVIKAQLQHILSSNPDRYSTQLRCHTYCKDIDNVKRDIATLNELSACVQDGQLFIIIDETPRLTMELLEKMKAKIPLMSVWCAGMSKLSNRPRWMVEKMLTVPLRSPPSISREVAKSNEITVYPNVPPYSSLTFTHATDGPPIRRLTHEWEPGHQELAFPDKCEACGRAIAQQLNDLDVGKSGPDSLQYRDILILCPSPHDEERNEDGEVTQEAMPMVKALRASGIPVKVVTKSSPDDDIEDLALAVTNTVVLSDIHLVVGLERRVVVGMKGLTHGRMDGMSRSIAHVIWIDDFPRH